MQPTQQRWWQTGVVYEIYPRSFADSNGDGIGDLPGIINRLDYLAWLGVDAVWLAPFYPSPMVDFGYDIADYTDVDPVFGNLDDFDRLLAGAHDRAIRVLIDYVPNHSSDQHPWFVESRSSRQNPKRDWYVWRDAAPGGGVPNNWVGMSGASTWAWDEPSGQYYLHSFLPQQPDLNWRNPAVRQAMFDVARWWLDRGVDGFRIDVAPLVMKDPQLRDGPPAPSPATDGPPDLAGWIAHSYGFSHGHPDMHELYRSFRALLDGYPGDRVSIGELHHPDYATWARYYGERQDEIHVPYNFHLAYADWRADAVRGAVEGVQAALPAGAFSSWVLGNHDLSRFASAHRAGRAQAKVGMLLLLTLRGMPTIYYGDEIGMVDVPIDASAARDPLGRDAQRTPMQWDSSPTAGFAASAARPWLPLAADADRVNVAAQQDDPDSLLSLTHRLLDLRRSDPVLRLGGFEPLGDTPDGSYAFRRFGAGRRLTVVLNLTDARLSVPNAGPGQVLIGTDRNRARQRVRDVAELGPNEAYVIEAG